jgi:L-methionine (R)-S-oxide reductase
VPIDSDAGFVAEIKGFVHRQSDVLVVLSEVVQRLHDRMSAWDWVGIYLLVDDTLVLGPYVGAPTEHTRIRIGVGLCGTAVARDTNIVVDDVRAQENYLACSAATRSELVVLIRDHGEVVGQFDVDSDAIGAFRRQDEVLLERLADIVGPACRTARAAVANESGSSAGAQHGQPPRA